MKLTIYIPLIALLGIVVLFDCKGKKGSENEMAMQLATRIAEIVNNGPVEIPGYGQDRIFKDPTGQLNVSQQTGSGTYNGTVELIKYESPMGKLSGKLTWKMDYINPPNSSLFERVVWDHVIHTLRGKLTDEDDQIINVRFDFKTMRGDSFPDKPYNISNITLTKVKIQMQSEQQDTDLSESALQAKLIGDWSADYEEYGINGSQSLELKADFSGMASANESDGGFLSSTYGRSHYGGLTWQLVDDDAEKSKPGAYLKKAIEINTGFMYCSASDLRHTDNSEYAADYKREQENTTMEHMRNKYGFKKIVLRIKSISDDTLVLDDSNHAMYHTGEVRLARREED